MLSEPRVIFFQTELKVPPIEQFEIPKSKDLARQIYNKMFEPGGYRYENLDLQAPQPTLSTRRESGQSICRVGTHSILIAESEPEFEVDEFVGVVKTILRAIGNDFPPFFIPQLCKIQCLSQPNNCENAVDLLGGKVANVLGSIDPFERPPSYFGVRFRFSAVDLHEVQGDADADLNEEGGESEPVADVPQETKPPDQAQATEHESYVTLRFETYDKDVTQVWMEAAAVYPLLIPVGDLDKVEYNIRETYRFLTMKAKKFLDQYDQPHDEESNDS